MTGRYEFDFFICHASEDKDEVARPLAERLVGKGVRVWYDENVLQIGDSLRERIDHGLASSKYGVVILSPSFFAKDWPAKELNGLAALEVEGRKVILPVWHDISADEIRQYSPLLADRLAARTDDGLDEVVVGLMAASGREEPMSGPTTAVPDVRVPATTAVRLAETEHLPTTQSRGEGLLLGSGPLHGLEDEVFALCTDEGVAAVARILRREVRALTKALFEGRSVETLVGAKASESLLSDPPGGVASSIQRLPPVMMSLMDCGETETARAALKDVASLYSLVPAAGDARIRDPLTLQKQLLYTAYAIGALAIDREEASVAGALLGWENARDSHWEGRSWIRYVATTLARQNVVRKSIIPPLKEHWAADQYLTDLLGGDEAVWDRLCQFDFLQCAHIVASGGDIGDCFASFSVFRRSRVQPMIEALIETHDEGIWIPRLTSSDLARLITALDKYAARWAGFEYDTWAIDRWSSSKIRMFLAEQGHEVR